MISLVDNDLCYLFTHMLQDSLNVSGVIVFPPNISAAMMKNEATIEWYAITTKYGKLDPWATFLGMYSERDWQVNLAN